MKKLFLVLIFSLLLLAGCSKSEEENVLYLYNWTYYTPDSVLKAFEEETGIKVIVDSFASNEEMFAKIQAGGGSGYDIIVPSADYTEIMIKLDMCEKLDHGKLPNIVNVTDKVASLAPFDPEMEYSVPYFIGTVGIAVDRKALEEAGIDYEHSWEIFADERLKGRMCMLDDMRQVLGAALMAEGESINCRDEAAIVTAAEHVENDWKPNLVKFDSESFAKSFARGEFNVVQCYPENVFAEIPEENWGNVDFFVPEEGGSMYIDSMVIPKNAKHKEAAYKFIDFFHRPEIYAMFLDYFHFPATANPAAAEYTTVEPFFDPEVLDRCQPIMDISEDLEKYNNVWQKIRYTN